MREQSGLPYEGPDGAPFTLDGVIPHGAVQRSGKWRIEANTITATVHHQLPLPPLREALAVLIRLQLAASLRALGCPEVDLNEEMLKWAIGIKGAAILNEHPAQGSA